MALKKILSAVLSLSLLAGVLAIAPATDAAGKQVSYQNEGGVSGSAQRKGNTLVLNLYDTTKVTKTTKTPGTTKTTTKPATTKKEEKVAPAEKETNELEAGLGIWGKYSFNRTTGMSVKLNEEVELPPMYDNTLKAYKGDDGRIHVVRDYFGTIVDKYEKTGEFDYSLFLRAQWENLMCITESKRMIGNSCYQEVFSFTPGTRSSEGTPAKVEVDPEYTVNWQVTITNQSTGESRIQHSGSSRLQMTIVFDKAGKYRIVADPVSNKGNVNWNGGRRVFEIEIEEDDVGKPIPFPSGGSPGTNTVGKDVFLSGGGAVKGNKYNKDNASKSGSGDRDWSWRSNGVRIKEVSR